jgi:ribosomal protein S18 acetylase RimI-like enzyme
VSELERAFEFIARGDMAGARREPSQLGVAVFDDALPLRHDSNYLFVDVDDVAPEELEREANRFGRRSIVLKNVELGERLASTFAEGWVVHRGLLMVHRRKPERAIDTGSVEEVDEAALRPARRAQLTGRPWATPEWMEQYLDAKLAIARTVDTRFFALRDGDRIASYTDLYLDGRTAQIEDVATLEEYRRRGYASAVVVRAIEEAHRAGCDFVFLATDADDRPQHLYRRLGFDDLGGYVKLFRP